MAENNGSARFQLNRADGVKIAKGLGVAVGGAVLAYAAEVFPQVEWGPWAGIAAALGSVLVNAGRKWLKNA